MQVRFIPFVISLGVALTLFFTVGWWGVLLAESGIVTTQKVTTHWQDIPELAGRYPDLRIQNEQRWVDEGGIVTSGGISAGIDMSLYLVSRLHSHDLAEQTARQMEYDWRQVQ